LGEEHQMRYYRRLPETTEWMEGKPAPQICNLVNFAHILLANEKKLKGIPQEPYLESWEAGKMVVRILDHNLVKLATSSNEVDMTLIQTQTGNMRMGTLARMLERELLLKWRHAICVRNYLYEYEESGVQQIPGVSSPCCFACIASFRIQKCSRCKEVFYCGIRCQKDDWKHHKKDVCNRILAMKKQLFIPTT
jgi:hypothetical protein